MGPDLHGALLARPGRSPTDKLRWKLIKASGWVTSSLTPAAPPTRHQTFILFYGFEEGLFSLSFLKLRTRHARLWWIMKVQKVRAEMMKKRFSPVCCSGPRRLGSCPCWQRMLPITGAVGSSQ